MIGVGNSLESSREGFVKHAPGTGALAVPDHVGILGHDNWRWAGQHFLNQTHDDDHRTLLRQGGGGCHVAPQLCLVTSSFKRHGA